MLGAVRILASDATYVIPDRSTLELLLPMYPSVPTDRRQAPPPHATPFRCGAEQLVRALNSFKPGLAAGPDGLTPQHIKDMVGGVSSTSFLERLQDFINLILGGGVPEKVPPYFFGAKLHALRKKDFGLRPIAVGLTMHRLPSKVENRWATECSMSLLFPRHLGVRVQGGAECVVHAARAYLDSKSPWHALAKLDDSNAFNSICRDASFEAVSRQIPDLLPYVLSAYIVSTILHFGELTIASSEGVQQGDPIVPLLFSLFSLAMATTLALLQCDFMAGHLDDVTLGGSVVSLASEVISYSRESSKIGLELNISKCEIIGLEESARQIWSTTHLDFYELLPQDTVLLGSQLFDP